MAYWLLKTEPDCYAWDNLVADKKTTWDGVTNALALKHLRSMNKGDLVLIYHTGKERKAVGIAEITRRPYVVDEGEGAGMHRVDIKPKKVLKRAVPLDEIKADPAFAGWDLLRISRLSVVPVPEPMWHHLLDLAR